MRVCQCKGSLFPGVRYDYKDPSVSSSINVPCDLMPPRITADEKGHPNHSHKHIRTLHVDEDVSLYEFLIMGLHGRVSS